MRVAEAVSILSDLEDQFERMSQGDRTFIEQLQNRFERFTNNVSLTDREAAKLTEIQGRYLR